MFYNVIIRLYKKIIFSGAILILSVTFLALGCKQTDSGQQNVTETSTILTDNPADYDSDFTQTQNLAKQKALEWRSDAKLVYVSIGIPASLNTKQISYSFVYDSSTLPTYHYLVTIAAESQSFVRSLIPKEDYLGSGYNQILPLYWKVNFVSALQKCDQEGGAKFREDYANDLQIEVSLSRETNEDQSWTCKYANIATSDISTIIINSSTGEVNQ